MRALAPRGFLDGAGTDAHAEADAFTRRCVSNACHRVLCLVGVLLTAVLRVLSSAALHRFRDALADAAGNGRRRCGSFPSSQFDRRNHLANHYGCRLRL